MSPRRFPFIRIAISVAVVTLVAWPMSNYVWSIKRETPYNSVTGAHPVYWLAPVSNFTSAYATLTWPALPALTEAVLGSLAGIGVFVLLGKWLRSRQRSETVCCGCGQILRDLVEPKCPSCGQRL